MPKCGASLRARRRASSRRRTRRAAGADSAPEDVSDKHIPLRIWWALEEQITRDADVVLSWLEESGVWQAPLFTEHLAGRIARRLAADRGDKPSFTRIDPDSNWKEYASHPRSRMPGGKGDYTEWETNYTPEVSDRSLTRLARLLEMAPATHAIRDRMLAGRQCWTGTGPARRNGCPQRLAWPGLAMPGNVADGNRARVALSRPSEAGRRS